MGIDEAAKQYSEQNHFASLTQCFKEVVNSEYVRQEKIKFALDVLEYLKAQCNITRQFKAEILLNNKIEELENEIT
jgi:hypothetical protein